MTVKISGYISAASLARWYKNTTISRHMVQVPSLLYVSTNVSLDKAANPMFIGSAWASIRIQVFESSNQSH